MKYKKGTLNGKPVYASLTMDWDADINQINLTNADGNWEITYTAGNMISIKLNGTTWDGVMTSFPSLTGIYLA
jgi:uncharacterized protein RhaS with RHS repeats